MIPILTAAAFGGVRVASAAGAANTARHIEQLAIVGGDVTQLAQAIENERDVTAGFIAAGHPARGQASLHKQYARTDSAARTVQARAARIGGGYSTDTRQRLSTVLARIRDLQGLRAAALRSQLPPLPMITDYSQVITDLFAFNDGIAEGSSDPQLADSVRALGFLSRTKDQASVQRAVLYAALTTGRFQPGGIDALTAAQAQQAADMATYLASATPAQRQLYMSTVTGPLVDQAQNIEQHAITQADSNLPLVTGNSATASRQWYTAMSDTIPRMHSIEREAVSSIIAHSRELRHGADRSALLTGVVMACVLIFSLIMTAIVARSLTRPLRRLRAGALQVAGARLPERVRQLSETGGGRDSLDVEPIEVFSTDEVGQVARAFDQVHREALRLAVNEASLRENINAMFVSLSRRSQSLVERQIRLIDELEQGEQDAERLGNLFRMDHLATRMRRNSENLLVLAGHEPTRRWGKPVALVDVMRAAVSEIEQYERITLSIQPGTSVVGNAVNDVVHLLAELLENATSFSPGDTPVKVTGHLLGSGGELLDITDQGVGMGSEEMAHANWRLENPPVVDVAVSRRMGLFVVARLAARHGIRVRLRQPELGGLTALIWLPDTLIAQDTTASTAWMRRLGAPGTEGLSGGGEAWSTPPSQAMFNAPAMPTSTMPTSTWTGPSRLADIEPMPTADSAPSYPADTAPPYAAERPTPARCRPQTPARCRPQTPARCRPQTPARCRPQTRGPCKPETRGPCKPQTPGPCRRQTPARCRRQTRAPCRPRTPARRGPQTRAPCRPQTLVRRRPPTSVPCRLPMPVGRGPPTPARCRPPISVPFRPPRPALCSPPVSARHAPPALHPRLRAAQSSCRLARRTDRTRGCRSTTRSNPIGSTAGGGHRGTRRNPSTPSRAPLPCPNGHRPPMKDGARRATPPRPPWARSPPLACRGGFPRQTSFLGRQARACRLSPTPPFPRRPRATGWPASRRECARLARRSRLRTRPRRDDRSDPARRGHGFGGTSAREMAERIGGALAWRGASPLNPAIYPAQDLDWIINNFIERVPDAAHALVVSSDGIPVASSAGLPPDRADQLAAVTSGLASLTQGAVRMFEGGAVTQTVVEMQNGVLIIMTISDGSVLAVLARRNCDMGLVAYEMTLLTERAGSALTPPVRGALQAFGQRN